MKKILLLLTTVLATMTMQAQQTIQIPQVNVSGNSEIKITPNYAVITIGVDTKNDKSEMAKKQNDEVIGKMLKTLKKYKIEDKHYQTQRINLYKTRDYEKKKDYFQANQSIIIQLHKLDIYDALMAELVENGANMIQGVEYKSTEVEKYETELRAKAVLNAKKKAEDFARPLGQKIGKAILISDNSSNIYNPRVYATNAKMEMADGGGMEPTLALGEIVLNSSITISFELL